jgi:hypothetical protein
MATKVKNGYKYSDTAFAAFIEKEKKHVSKFNKLVLAFGILFGLPLAYLVLASMWKLIKWLFAIT